MYVCRAATTFIVICLLLLINLKFIVNVLLINLKYLSPQILMGKAEKS